MKYLRANKNQNNNNKSYYRRYSNITPPEYTGRSRNLADKLVKSARCEHNARDKISEILKKFEGQTMVFGDSSYLLLNHQKCVQNRV